MSARHESFGHIFSSFYIGGSERGLDSGKAGDLRDPPVEFPHLRNGSLKSQRDDMIFIPWQLCHMLSIHFYYWLGLGSRSENKILTT